MTSVSPLLTTKSELKKIIEERFDGEEKQDVLIGMELYTMSHRDQREYRRHVTWKTGLSRKTIDARLDRCLKSFQDFNYEYQYEKIRWHSSGLGRIVEWLKKGFRWLKRKLFERK